MREPVKLLISPTGRIRLTVTGRAPLDHSDHEWLRWLAAHPGKIHEVLNEGAAEAAQEG